MQPLETVNLDQMIEWGRTALHNPANVLKSARHVQRELPRRLARRLLDLQVFQGWGRLGCRLGWAGVAVQVEQVRLR